MVKTKPMGKEKASMPFTFLASVNPATGNVSASTYIIVIAVAAVLIVGAVIAGIVSKKKKK
ncbi:MAG: hypothetical protein K2G87_03340 [Oscillospiraceae bacterium]|nr:hypothetical protein [Oscillospiraceae bacterium]